MNDRGESKCQGYGYFCLTLVVQSIIDIKMINLSTMGGGGGWYSLIWAILACASPKGMVFELFWSEII